MKNFYDKCVFFTKIYHVITQSRITPNLLAFNLTQSHKIEHVLTPKGRHTIDTNTLIINSLILVDRKLE